MQEEPTLQEPKLEPIWCVGANIVQEHTFGPGQTEIRRGTKHFPPGAKVHCVSYFWDGEFTSVEVVGRHRSSHRYVTIVVRHEWLTNFRVEMVYSPYFIKKVQGTWVSAHLKRDGSPEAKAQAEQDAAWLINLSGEPRYKPAV